MAGSRYTSDSFHLFITPAFHLGGGRQQVRNVLGDEAHVALVGGGLVLEGDRLEGQECR